MKTLIYITSLLLLSSLSNAQMACSSFLEDSAISLDQAMNELDLDAVSAEQQKALNSERAELLEELLKGFTSQKREIIELKYIDEKTVSEIATELNLSTSRVSTLIKEIEKKFEDLRRFRDRRNSDVIAKEFLENQINTARIKYSRKFYALHTILHRHFKTYGIDRHGMSSLFVFMAEEMDPQIKITKGTINRLMDSINRREEISGSSVEAIEASYSENSKILREEAQVVLGKLSAELKTELSSVDLEKLQTDFRRVFTGHYTQLY